MMLSIALTLLLAQPKVDKDIVYSTAGGEEIKMDIHYPVVAQSKPTPCVVVIHGGAWMAGVKKDMDQLSEAIAANGMLAANIDYRLAPKSKYPAMIDDVQTAVRFLRANAAKYNIDPTRIAAGGASAGGHLSLMLGFTDTRDPNPKEFPKESSRVSAVLDLFGPTDLSSSDYPKSLDLMYLMVLGKPRDQAAAEIKAASPMTYISPTVAPVFIIQGTVDPLVNVNQSKSLEAKLKELKVPVDAIYVEGLGHGPGAKDTEEIKKAFLSAVSKGVEWLKSKLAAPIKAKQAA